MEDKKNMKNEAVSEFADSLLAARKQLESNIKNGQPAPAETKALQLGDIQTCEVVFQHRIGELARSQVHIGELVKALKRNPKQPFTPILVFWIGDRWCCIDGHHRLAAYHQARFKQVIPVTIFNGTLDEAIAMALSSNSRDKLSYTREQKSNAAWRLVISTKFSIAAIAGISLRSKRQVSYMREAMYHILERHPGYPLDSLSWLEADQMARGAEIAEDVGSEDWVEAKAQELANRLSKHFKDRLSVNPEVTARALEIYSMGLVEHLSEWWNTHDHDDEFDLEDSEESDF